MSAPVPARIRMVPALSGAHWHDLPERYGKWKTIRKRFACWAEAGVWEKVFASLTATPDNEYLMLDSTMVRAR